MDLSAGGTEMGRAGIERRVRSRQVLPLVGAIALASPAAAVELSYAPAPVDNPLKGLVPYVAAGKKDRFPHAMEFRYFSLKTLMVGPDEFDWRPLERTLKEVSGRGKHLIFRVYCEYPGKGDEVPAFLKETGVKVTKWKGEGEVSFTPDYRSPVMRKALRDFIIALGKKYDGDARIGFLTAGLLGSWGEWHTYPRDDLWAPKEVQREVMEAYAKAFTKTKILLRYPAGPKTFWHEDNHERPFGYHDDSFCWATLDTGKEADHWYFEPSLRAAGATEKWQRFPIGGEIRPELWKTSFTEQPHPRDQGFLECVERLHVTWLMDTGLFDPRFPMEAARRQRALRDVRRMGYELYVSRVEWAEGTLTMTVENRGVAPFYYDWPVELFVGDSPKAVPAKIKLSGVLPGKPVKWRFKVEQAERYLLRVPNPMTGGSPLKFANKEQGAEGLEIHLAE